MGTISVSLPSDGTTADVADFNTPINTIVNEINGELDNANIASDAAIDGSKLANASITNAKLSTTAGDIGGAWLAWTPTLSGRFTDGDWTKNCSYTKIGKTVHFVFDVTATDATPMAGGTGEATFTLPVTAASSINTTNNLVLGVGRALDSGTAVANVQIEIASTTTARIRVLTSSGTYLSPSTITSTVPHTWTTSDAITVSGTYEAA